jgi:hypothetical protein
MTIANLEKLTNAGQWSELYLTFDTPPVVFSRLVAMADPIVIDNIRDITYDGTGTGTYTDVVAGMTLWVGSDPETYDKGRARVLSATSSVITIAPTSEIAFEDNDYLTVVNDYDLWARIVEIYAEDIYIDITGVYTDQHVNHIPFPVLGPPGVLWLTGETVDFEPDASGSWCLGDSIAADPNGYLWAAPGASDTADLDTATPTITYDAAGRYMVSCKVTATNGKYETGYRKVFVYDANNMPEVAFKLESCSGNYEDGGWSFEVTMFDGADLTEVHDRAFVILHAKDFYGADGQLSMGPVVGSEHIIAWGWIDEESIDWSPELGSCRFTVYGPAHWLDRLAVQPFQLQDIDDTPVSFVYADEMTVDQAFYGILRERTTAWMCLDIIQFTNDDRRVLMLSSPTVSCWSQLCEIAKRVFAKPCFNRYGQLYIEIDTQMLPAADRLSIPIPVIRAIAEVDWTEPIEIERQPNPDCTMIEVSGAAFTPNVAGSTHEDIYISRAFGTVRGRWGIDETIDNVILTDQDDCNQLAGLAIALKNIPYPRVGIHFACNDRSFDICPRQYLTLTIIDTDTPRGVAWTAQKLIPREIEYKHEPESGLFLVDAGFEPDTATLPGYVMPTGVAIEPTEDQYPVDNNAPIAPTKGPKHNSNPYPWPPNDEVPDDPNVPDPCRGLSDAPANGPWLLFISGPLNSFDTPPFRWMNFPAYVRAAGSEHETTVTIDGTFQYNSGGVWLPALDCDWIDVTVKDFEGIVAHATADPATYPGQSGTRIFIFEDEPPAGADIEEVDIVVSPRNNSIDDSMITFQDSDEGAYEINDYGFRDEVTTSTPYSSAVFKLVLGTDWAQGRIVVEVEVIDGCVSGDDVGVKLGDSTDVDPSYTPSITTMGSSVGLNKGDVYQFIGSSWNPSAGINYLRIMGHTTAPYTPGPYELKILRLGWKLSSTGEITWFWATPSDTRILVNNVRIYNICEHS